MAYQPPKPLWKFGWAGYCASAILGALVLALACGVDVRFWIFSKVTSLLGIKALYWFVGSWLTSNGIYDFPFISANLGWRGAPFMRFSLVTMCLVLVALQVHPRRTRICRWIPVVAMGVLVPGLTYSVTRWFIPHYGSSTPASPTEIERAFTKWQCASGLLSIAVVALATRSVLNGLVTAGFVAGGTWLSLEADRASAIPPLAPLFTRVHPTMSWFIQLSWAWNPLLFAWLLVWAIRARRAVHPEYACQKCGYDVRRSPPGPCPECGAMPITTPAQPA